MPRIMPVRHAAALPADVDTIDDPNDTCFIVRDANGQALSYVHFEQEPGRRTAANLFTGDEGAAHHP
jgi:hypothetical protein